MVRAGLVLGAAFLLLAFGESRGEQALRGGGRAVGHFYGESNIHPFEGVTDTVEFAVGGETEADNGVDSVVWSEFRVPVRSLTTHLKARDEDMYRMFEAERYPDIVVRVPPVSPDRLRPNGLPDEQRSGTVLFEMTIRETARRLRGVVRKWREDEGGCSFEVRFAVSLERFGLKPPRPFFGVLYVKDTVAVVVPVWVRAVERQRAADGGG